MCPAMPSPNASPREGDRTPDLLSRLQTHMNGNLLKLDEGVHLSIIEQAFGGCQSAITEQPGPLPS